MLITPRQDDLDVTVANVMDTFAEINPSKVVDKIKIHLATHTRYDVLRFGPLLGVSTESFESFNGVFRYCSIYSNHIAPSRDIAVQLADQESYKHRVTGGYWPTKRSEVTSNNTEVGDGVVWQQAGWAVRDYLDTQPMLQGLIGWTPEHVQLPGKTLIYDVTTPETLTY